MIVNSYYTSSSGYIHIIYSAVAKVFLEEGFQYIHWPENCLIGSLFEIVNGPL